MQTFRLPAEPGARVMRKEPSDMTCEGPFHMLYYWRGRCRPRCRTRNRKGKGTIELGASIMIFGPRSTELLFKVRQCAVLPIHPFDFNLTKTLNHRSVLHNRHVVECDVCDRRMVRAHTNPCAPDLQSSNWHKFLLPNMDKQ